MYIWLASNSSRDRGRLSGPTNAYIGQKSQNASKSSFKAGKSLVDLLGLEDATWEHEDAMQEKYSQLFE